MIDSRPATYEHIADVRGLMLGVVSDLLQRAHVHDRSKLEEPELSMFDEFTELLHELTYGSPEYEQARAKMLEGPLAHHYEHNRHHPEYHADGIQGMTLVDLVEMLCDWLAASRRHADGDIVDSIEKNQARFGYGDELKQIFLNTIEAPIRG